MYINKLKENKAFYESSDQKSSLFNLNQNLEYDEDTNLEVMGLVRREDTEYTEYISNELQTLDSFYENIGDIDNEIFDLLDEEKYGTNSFKTLYKPHIIFMIFNFSLIVLIFYLLLIYNRWIKWQRWFINNFR